MFESFSLSSGAGRVVINYQVSILGGDIAVVFGGGAEHIGTAALAVARPSLEGGGKVSSTASIINVTSHKDGSLSESLALKISSALNKTCCVCGGFHLDAITPEEIKGAITANEIASGLIIKAIKDKGL